MTPSQNKAIRELREAGYAVITWTPEEVGNANADKVENRVCELGNEVIEDMS